MRYPKEMMVAGQRIPVTYFDDYIYREYKCVECGLVADYSEEHPTCCKACKSTKLAYTGQVVTGAYDGGASLMKITMMDDRDDIVGVNLTHETIEAVNSICDLHLTHTQISVLGATLYQAFASGEVDFAAAIAA